MVLRDIKLYLLDIKKAIENIEEYTRGIDFRKFVENTEKVDAVIRNLEIIGEAAKKIPKNMREKHKMIKWESIIGMRNIIVHEYFGVDLEIIWKTINERLPELKNEIETML